MPRLSLISSKNLDRKDLVKIHTLHKKEFSSSSWRKDYFFDFLNKRNKPLLYLLKNNSSFIGFALGRISKNNHRQMHLSTLWVSKKYRGAGLGRQLVKKFGQTSFRRKSVAEISVNFRTSDLKKLYSGLGFSNFKTIGLYRNGDVKHFMTLTKKDFYEKF